MVVTALSGDLAQRRAAKSLARAKNWSAPPMEPWDEAATRHGKERAAE